MKYHNIFEIHLLVHLYFLGFNPCILNIYSLISFNYTLSNLYKFEFKFPNQICQRITRIFLIPLQLGYCNLTCFFFLSAECNQTFTQYSSLQKHARVHDKQKPYKCTHPGCDQAFSQVCIFTLYSCLPMIESFTID